MKQRSGRAAFLNPLQEREVETPRVVSFDTETANRNLDFVLGSISYGPWPFDYRGDEHHEFYYSADEMLAALARQEMWDASVWATNLQFDFMALTEGGMRPGWTLFHNGAKFVYGYYADRNKCKSCKGYRCGIRECKECEADPREKCEHECLHGSIHKRRVSLYDSLNIFPASVREMGFILSKVSEHHAAKGDGDRAKYFDIKKMETPSWFDADGGKRLDELNEKQGAYLHEYNLADSLVTRKFMEWMAETFAALGVGLKATIPSIAMDLWRKKFLSQSYLRPSIGQNNQAREAYYGGRTEVFWYGLQRDLWAYDFKSMYPWAMKHQRYPNPNDMRTVTEGLELSHLEQPGVSHVRIHVPSTNHVPVLPWRHTEWEKVIFPVGTFEGTWTNDELRYAIKEQDAKILRYDWAILSDSWARPFDSFIDTMWAMRADFLRQDNPADLIIKLVMNSLYGKFGMNDAKENVFEYLSIEDSRVTRAVELFTERINPKLQARGIMLKPMERPPDFPFVNTVWASYVTGWARLRLHEHIMRGVRAGVRVLYCDTDSLFCNAPLSFGVKKADLGELEEKGTYAKGVFVAPKLYYLENTTEGAEKKRKKAAKKGNVLTDEEALYETAVKGVPYKARKSLPTKLSQGELSWNYSKFATFREALGRTERVRANEDIQAHKSLNPLNQPKRRIVGGPTLHTIDKQQFDSRPWEMVA